MSTSPPHTSGRAKPSTRQLFGAVLGGLLVLFAALNSQSVTVHWLVTTTKAPLIVVIAACSVVAFAAGWLFARRATRRKAGR